jgi:hypothetical protein
MEEYFGRIWQDENFENLKYSGYQLVNYVNSKNPKRVLDVGCGFNRFKGKINNLWGIDPYNELADHKISLEEYKGPTVDIALCLGSINFGDEKTINNQIKILDSIWTKECIFRVNPGLEHTWRNKEDYNNVQWYPWTTEKISKISNQYNYALKCLEKEYNIHGHLRYYFIFAKY